MSSYFYKCVRCGFESSKPILHCPRCGSIVHFSHGFKWFIDSSRSGIYRFSSMLPVFSIENSLGEGFTPLIKSSRLSNETGVSRLYFKNEGCNPTGSFRDRVAALLTSHAYELGYRVLVCGTDGNLGASLTAYASRLGFRVEAFVPRGCDWGKLVLMKSFGAHVIEHGESLDDVYGIVEKYALDRNYYNATSEANALSIEALKTIALEIYIDLGCVPDHIFIPIGSGLTLYSIYHGFTELLEHGIIDRTPHIHGVETCWNPRISLRLGYSVDKCVMEPIIGLAYRYPPLEKEVVDIIRDTGGGVWVVDRREVFYAGEELARKEGLFVEPAAATSYAGFTKALKEGFIGSSESVVILLTGHGLKAFEHYTRKLRVRKVRNVFPSETKLEILRVLDEKGVLHGYGVWRELGLDISVQAVYQHLRDLEKKGIVISRIMDGKKYYMLTDRGRIIVEVLDELLRL